MLHSSRKEKLHNLLYNAAIKKVQCEIALHTRRVCGYESSATLCKRRRVIRRLSAYNNTFAISPTSSRSIDNWVVTN